MCEREGSVIRFLVCFCRCILNLPNTHIHTHKHQYPINQAPNNTNKQTNKQLHPFNDHFSPITTNTTTTKLNPLSLSLPSQNHSCYRHPDDIDLWSGGVSERPLPGSMVGPTFSCLIGITFKELRYGDRFWYENRGQPSEFTPGACCVIVCLSVCIIWT